VSSRNEYAEAAVWEQTIASGYQDQMVNTLTELQSKFDISGNSGIPKALNDLFQSFSAWATTPDNLASRQAVVDRATQLASTFQQTYNAIAEQATNTEQQIRQTVDEVNQKIAEIQNYNHIALQGNKNDSGLNARMHAALEELGQYVDFSAHFEADGTVSITIAGQTPLLLEDKQYSISAGIVMPQNPPPTNPNAPANARIFAQDGSDITSLATGGQLGALLTLRNQVQASIIGDAYQSGDLNTLASQFASRVNDLLTNGQITAGPPPQSGIPLFTYDTTNATDAAQTLAVNPAMTPAMLAAIDPGPPSVSNGIPLALAQLATPVAPADKINGLSFSQYYGQLAARIGGDLNDAQNNQEVQQSLLAQAKSLRDQYSGVNLDEEATILIQFQRAYQANSRFISVLNELTQDAIDIIKP
jgi:flagellar hook-associated protein 1 FlgK